MMKVVSGIWHNVLIKPWFLIWISCVIAFYAIRRWWQIRWPWHMRVSEASVRKALTGSDAVQYEQEHRIEVATVRLAPMKILRPLRFGLSGPKSPKFMEQQRFEGWVSEPPLTVEREQREWHHVALMPPWTRSSTSTARMSPPCSATSAMKRSSGC